MMIHLNFSNKTHFVLSTCHIRVQRQGQTCHRSKDAGNHLDGGGSGSNCRLELAWYVILLMRRHGDAVKSSSLKTFGWQWRWMRIDESEWNFLGIKFLVSGRTAARHDWTALVMMARKHTLKAKCVMQVANN
jgi:hypothetical protein